MRNKDYNETIGFITRYFGVHDGAVELRACPNVKGEPGAESLITRDATELRDFCRRKDVDGIGTYFGACVRRDGATSGSTENVVSCPALWVDIDCVKQGLVGQDVISALEYLPHPPTIIINSGGGLHAYWMLEEAIDLAIGREQVTQALRALVLILAGDMQCAEVARIMRLPGTMNSKPATKAVYEGEAAICEVLSDTGAVHDFDTLCEWLADQRAVLQGKAKEQVRAVREADPFVAYARAAGYEPAIDIEAELAAMEYGSTGRNSIHETQLRVSMSMIARGHDDDEIVEKIIAATERAAPRDTKWNWRAEEKAIRKMISSGREKAKDRPTGANSAQVRPATNGNAAVKLVVDNPEPKPKKEPRESKSDIVIAGRAAISVWQDRHGPVIHTNGSTYVYDDGIWTEWDDRLAQRLRSIIQEACASLNIDPKTSLLNAVKAYFMDRPELIRHNVQFDRHGLLVANDACLDLRTMEIVAHSPDHYATSKASANLTGPRDAPALAEFLGGAFSDREEGRAIISTVQEWFGAAIMPLHVKTRAMLKGLLVHGASRCGKTQVSELARYLLGHDHVCGSRMADLSDRFGREPLIGKRGWIADDAIGEAEILDAETYKVVVTGERTSAMRKGGKNWDGKFGIPVMLTANNMPRVKDQSEATYNRSLIVSMTNIRPEDAPEPAGYTSIAEKIGTEELTGLLWWAIEGWQRLVARGTFNPPATMTDAARAFKDENNPVGAWLAQCVEVDHQNKVARLDLVASFNGWRQMEHDDAKAWGSNTITRRIQSQMPQLFKVKLNGETCFCGLRLNEEGLFAWQRTKETAGFEKKPTFSEHKEDVNRFYAGKQDQKEEVPRDTKPRF